MNHRTLALASFALALGLLGCAASGGQDPDVDGLDVFAAEGPFLADLDERSLGVPNAERPAPPIELAPPGRPDLEGTVRDQVLAGVLRDARGLPIAGARLASWVEPRPDQPLSDAGVARFLADDETALLCGSCAMTDHEGRFRLDRLWPVEQRVSVSAPGSWITEDFSTIARLTPSATGSHVELVNRRSLAGGHPNADIGEGLGAALLRITAPNGWPMSGHRITVSREPATGGVRNIAHDSHGLIGLESPAHRHELGPGRYSCFLVRSTFYGCGIDAHLFSPRLPWFSDLTAEFEVHEGETTLVDLALPPAGRLSVLVGEDRVVPRLDAAYIEGGVTGHYRAPLEDPAHPLRIEVVATPLDGAGEPRALSFFLPAISAGSTAPALFQEVRTLGADLLSPGRYRLDFRHNTAEIEPCVAVIAAGRITEVERRLPPGGTVAGPN